jgi:hypothetical protein
VIRAGDDFVAASVSLLRNLFFPQSRCLLVPTFKAHCVVKDGYATCYINGFLRNAGSATAFDTLAITHYDPKGLNHSFESWQSGPTLDPHYSRAKMPIHPGVREHFFQMTYGAPTFANPFIYRIRIFAQDSEPAEWQVSFTEAEIRAGVEKSGVRRSLFFRPEAD